MPHFPRALIPAIALIAATPAAFVPAAPAIADTTAADDAGPGSGVLMLRGPRATEAAPAVRLGTDMAVEVSGMVARVRVIQAFRNASDRWMEAIYLYPLPDDGAVDGLRMVVGNRVIVGHIERREAARARYEQAKASGHKAGLVEQQRPNMFSTAVANVGPGETVLIAIDYQAPVAESHGTFSLRLPLVVGPRYTPPHTLASAAAVADALAVTAAPVMNPHIAFGPGVALDPTSIRIHLRPGFVPANLISRYHRIAIAGDGADRTISLAAGTVPADRDFELDWRSTAADPSLGLFHEKTAKGEYVMATITPPSDLSGLPTSPREMVFVIDNSGSMGGSSMEEAKASLLHALATLRPQDHFNIIRFDDTMTRLFPRSVAATADRIAFARRFASGLEAKGGTEMVPALDAALADAAASGGAGVLRQIVFLTDGEISNEQEMLTTLAADGGRSHIFFVGIGSAPNDFLMRRMATMGRGTYTHVGTPEEVAARMMPLLDSLAHPAIEDLSVKVGGAALDLTPRTLPDVYAGQPLVLVGKADRLPKESGAAITVSGTIGGKPWTQTLGLATARDGAGIARLWARRRIDDVEADRTLGKLDATAADAAVTTLGLENGIVTSQTSLIAVDETPSRPAGASLTREELPIDLPAGWDFDTLFGLAKGPAAGAAPAGSATPLDLPQTATGFIAALLQGALLLAAGLAGLVLRRRRARA